MRYHQAIGGVLRVQTEGPIDLVSSLLATEARDHSLHVSTYCSTYVPCVRIYNRSHIAGQPGPHLESDGFALYRNNCIHQSSAGS